MSSEPTPAEPRATAPNGAEPDHELHRHPGELVTVWVLWLVYGAFYFCRTNMAVVQTGLKQATSEGGLSLSAEQVGYIQGALKFCYAIGQLVNGQFAEHISPRKLLAFGMFGSALLTASFGFVGAFWGLVLIWGLNGYFQSLGWTPCIRVVGNWIPVERRGKAIGLIGTGYQVTQGVTFLVAGFAALWFGWRGALYVPAGMLAAAGLFMLVFLKESPDDHRSDSAEHRRKATPAAGIPFSETLRLTITNPALWILGASLGLLNAVRYGYIDWGISHLIEVQGSTIDKSALKYVILPLGAVFGAYYTGTITDRFFGGRRAPAIFFVLTLLAALTVLYEHAARTSVTLTIGLLPFIGYCIYGPQVLLVGTAPSDLAKRGTGAAAAGFVNFMGYVGGGLGDIFTGISKERFGWQATIYMWAGWALAAALIAALLWNAQPRPQNADR